MKKIALKLSILIIISTIATANDKKIDEETGLIIDNGIELIKENCIICHPPRFMLINGGDKKFWSAKVKLMQKGFGLWELDKNTKERIINYLSKNYPKKGK